MAGLGSYLESVLVHYTYDDCELAAGISYNPLTTSVLCSNNIQNYAVPCCDTARSSAITVNAPWVQWVNNYHQVLSCKTQIRRQMTETAQQQTAWYQMGDFGAYDPEVARRLQGEETRRIEALRRDHEERTRLATVAESTAEKLLVEHLDEKQLDQFRNHRYFEVVRDSGKRVYRIKHGWAGNIEVFEGGRLVETMCIHPSTQVPHSDNLLAQKLLLEADETRFRQIANITRREA